MLKELLKVIQNKFNKKKRRNTNLDPLYYTCDCQPYPMPLHKKMHYEPGLGWYCTCGKEITMGNLIPEGDLNGKY